MTAFLYLCIALQLLHLTVAIAPIVPTVSFESSSTVSIPEGTSADVCLTITGAAAGPITILLGATDQSAIAPDDYTAPSSVTYIPGGSNIVCISITAVQDNVDEPSENFTYTILAGMGDYAIGAPSNITITIPGAPPPPPPCPCKDRIATLACKHMENNGEYLPMPCRELLGNNP
ncbi:PREDICTED: uncharacterized protein LOC109593769 [Amphimedon queenslandica]|uniref:Calx-beta domain-containing protein n=1 Tax=Amphimedon queenslandica TaxID=400682 RepID=A0AAN0K595_AMPQE|nr:PREDICTED: uncharacterized protein LOC109593769 [Amphimedon queenslandica]|eukprot:XP_019864415.1 PREDICTED: uncharacterized protein LOC109593769 [Amphimedon queenslandica]